MTLNNCEGTWQNLWAPLASVDTSVTFEQQSVSQSVSQVIYSFCVCEIWSYHCHCWQHSWLSPIHMSVVIVIKCFVLFHHLLIETILKCSWLPWLIHHCLQDCIFPLQYSLQLMSLTVRMMIFISSSNLTDWPMLFEEENELNAWVLTVWYIEFWTVALQKRPLCEQINRIRTC